MDVEIFIRHKGAVFEVYREYLERKMLCGLFVLFVLFVSFVDRA